MLLPPAPNLDNPLRARLFAEAAGTLAKTDAIDARMLALMGERLDPAATAPLRDIVETVQELARARSAAIAERIALTNRIGIVTSPFLRRELNRKVQAVERHIARLEDELDRIIVADPVLARRHAILCSIPGIGAVTATAIIAVARKLLVLANTLVAHDRPWTPIAP